MALRRGGQGDSEVIEIDSPIWVDGKIKTFIAPLPFNRKFDILCVLRAM